MPLFGDLLYDLQIWFADNGITRRWRWRKLTKKYDGWYNIKI